MSVTMIPLRPLLFIVIASMMGCNDLNDLDKPITDDNLTKQFELLKGTMRPVEGYDSTLLSHKRILPMYTTACITMDQQIYICKDACKIKAVSIGQVRRIFKSELGAVVLIKSGKYLTVFRHLEYVMVEEGEWVDRETQIGQSLPSGSLYFEVYKAASKFHPSEWVKL